MSPHQPFCHSNSVFLLSEIKKYSFFIVFCGEYYPWKSGAEGIVRIKSIPNKSYPWNPYLSNFILQIFFKVSNILLKPHPSNLGQTFRPLPTKFIFLNLSFRPTGNFILQTILQALSFRPIPAKCAVERIGKIKIENKAKQEDHFLSTSLHQKEQN